MKLDDVELFENSLSLIFNPVIMKLESALNVKIPKKIQSLFSKSCDLFNKRISESPFEIVRSREKRNNAEYFYDLLHMGVQHGIAAALYNLDIFLRYISIIKQESPEILKSYNPPNRNITSSLSANKLIFEYEHFTLHLRIVLDRINWFFNYFFLYDSRNLYKLCKVLESKVPNDLYAVRVLSVINSNREFLDEFISTNKSEKRTERDLLAHREEIQFITTNIIISPDKKIRVFFVSDKENLNLEGDKILKQRFDSLINFTDDIISTFFDFKGTENCNS